MSSTMIKFEVFIPQSDVGTSEYNAEQSFISNMQALAPINFYQVATLTNGVYSQCNAYYGIIQTTQGSTALSYLNALNTALGFNVTAYSYTITTQP